jgi:hypothetical protein
MTHKLEENHQEIVQRQLKQFRENNARQREIEDGTTKEEGDKIVKCARNTCRKEGKKERMFSPRPNVYYHPDCYDVTKMKGNKIDETR